MTFAHLDDIRDQVDPLARTFEAAGHRIYLVGGIVRDQWLDFPLHRGSDIDLTTEALPAVIKQIVGPIADVLWTQGERFGTIGMRIGNRAYEITTHRAESYSDDSRKPHVTFGDDIAVDLSRRDFTVNAMAIEIPSGELIDPWGGADDLAAGLLRTPLTPDISFSDDPLRMLRAARFMTKYKLVPTEELSAAASALHERLRIVAIERIGDELERLLGLDDPTPGLRFLLDTGLLAEVVCYGEPGCVDRPALERGLDIAGRLASGLSPSRGASWRTRLAALLFGAFESTDSVYSATGRLRMAGGDRRATVSTVRDARGILDATEFDPPMLRRWLVTVADRHEAQILARAIAPSPDPRCDRFAKALAAIENNEAAEPPILLSGEAIMQLLDVESGPVIGEAISFLQERYFDEGQLGTTRQQELLVNWWTDRAATTDTFPPG